MAKAMFSENAQTVISYLQSGIGDVTADDIAAATGLTARSVNGTVTGLAKKGLAQRVEKEGFDKKVISLTAEGMGVDPAAEVE